MNGLKLSELITAYVESSIIFPESRFSLILSISFSKKLESSAEGRTGKKA